MTILRTRYRLGGCLRLPEPQACFFFGRAAALLDLLFGMREAQALDDRLQQNGN